MARAFNTPGLFARGDGQGCGTAFECCLCGNMHKPEQGGCVNFVNLGKGMVGECCFDTVEDFVFNNMPYILPWFAEILKVRADDIGAQRDRIAKLLRGLNANLQSSMLPGHQIIDHIGESGLLRLAPIFAKFLEDPSEGVPLEWLNSNIAEGAPSKDELLKRAIECGLLARRSGSIWAGDAFWKLVKSAG